MLVTGGNRGIGLAVAQDLVRRGHRVAVTARDGEVGHGLLKLKCDVTDTSQVRQYSTRSRRLTVRSRF